MQTPPFRGGLGEVGYNGHTHEKCERGQERGTAERIKSSKNRDKEYTWGFLYTVFGPASNLLGASAAPKTIPKGGGRSPPPSGMVFGAAGASQTPKIDDFRPAQKPCIKNPSLNQNCRSDGPRAKRLCLRDPSAPSRSRRARPGSPTRVTKTIAT
jgi:hypothetical protein